MRIPPAPLPAGFFFFFRKRKGGSSIFYEGRLSKIGNGKFAAFVANFTFLRVVFKVTR